MSALHEVMPSIRASQNTTQATVTFDKMENEASG